MNNANVCVIMSSYNGENFLDEQIDSIINQKNVNVTLLIRDDDSSDTTKDILKKWSERPNILVYLEDNIGVGKSFMRALSYSKKFDFYAFSDQDDVWKSNKLELAVKKMKEYDLKKPILYYSNYELVDVNKNKLIRRSESKFVNYESAFFQSRAIGCSMVFNHEAKLLMEKFKLPKNSIHDYWMYRVVYSMGEVVFDKTKTFYYRQHANNVIGENNNIFSYWINRFNRIKNIKVSKIDEAGIIYNMLEKHIIDTSKKDGLKKIALSKKNFKYKLELIKSKNVYGQTKIDTILLKIAFALNKL